MSPCCYEASVRGFCYSRGTQMIFILFYLLVLGQIGLGVYSLYEGFVWLRMVRRRVARMPDFTRRRRR